MRKKLLVTSSTLVLGTLFSPDLEASRAYLLEQARQVRTQQAPVANQADVRQAAQAQQQLVAERARAVAAEQERQRLAQELLNQVQARDASLLRVQEQLAAERLAAQEAERVRLQQTNLLAEAHQEQLRLVAEQMRQLQEQARITDLARLAAEQEQARLMNQLRLMEEARAAAEQVPPAPPRDDVAEDVAEADEQAPLVPPFVEEDEQVPPTPPSDDVNEADEQAPPVPPFVEEMVQPDQAEPAELPAVAQPVAPEAPPAPPAPPVAPPAPAAAAAPAPATGGGLFDDIKNAFANLISREPAPRVSYAQPQSPLEAALKNRRGHIERPSGIDEHGRWELDDDGETRIYTDADGRQFKMDEGNRIDIIDDWDNEDF